MTKQLVASIIIVLGLGLLFLVSYLLNKKTPKPEGCDQDDSECANCPVTTCLKNIDKEKK